MNENGGNERQSRPVQATVGPEEVLHIAVCQAVGLLNSSIEMMSIEAGREVRNILRQALVDYADAYMDQPVTEEERSAMVRGHALPNV